MSVIWITGLSGAGKTTLSKEVFSLLRLSGVSVIRLDGDELRSIFGTADLSSKNHGRSGRLALAMQYSNLCRMLALQGVVVVIATISMFEEVHQWNRENLPGYFEVFLDVPIDELRSRDPKGIYRRFDSGDLTNVAGLDLPVDEPAAPDWVVEFDSGLSMGLVAQDLINKLKERDLV